MKKIRTLVEALTDAGLLIDSGEIEHVIGLLREDTVVLRGEFLGAQDSVRLTACGPAAIIAKGIRKTIRGCFSGDAPWPLETAKEINSAVAWYSSTQHGECLIEALALANHAASYGLDEIDLWRLRARLTQLVAFYVDDKRPKATSKAKAAQLARDGDTDKAKTRACQYVQEHFMSSNGRPATQAALALAVWNMLREHGRAETNAYMPPAGPDGGPTRSSIDTIKRWFAAEYAHQKNMYLKTQG